jgi:hypothetical protein
MSVIRLGNPQAINHATGALIPGGERVTELHIPEGYSRAAAVAAVTHVGESTSGVWAAHSAAEGPSWVWSDDDDLAAALAAHYGCPVGEPDTDHTPEG